VTLDDCVDAHDLAHSRAVDVGHLGQVQHELLVPLIEQAVDRVLDRQVASDRAPQVEDENVPDGPCSIRMTPQPEREQFGSKVSKHLRADA
jgi:hypothetical protein